MHSTVIVSFLKKLCLCVYACTCTESEDKLREWSLFHHVCSGMELRSPGVAASTSAHYTVPRVLV